MEQLTKKEEQIMQILWRIKKGFVKDIISQLPEPQPPYNTISSIVRILEKKGFVNYNAYGKTHEYFPAISKVAYRKYSFKQMLAGYFDGSYKNVVSFLSNESEIDEKTLNELEDLIDKKSEKSEE